MTRPPRYLRAGDIAVVQALDLDDMPTVDEPMSAGHRKETDPDIANR